MELDCFALLAMIIQRIPQTYPQMGPALDNTRFNLNSARGALSSFLDRSCLVLPDARDRQGRVGLGAEAATSVAPEADLILVPSSG